MQTKLEIWYVFLGGIWTAGHFAHLGAGARALLAAGYLLLSALFFWSLCLNNPARSDPMGVLEVTGPHAMLCLGLSVAPSLPLPVVILGYMGWAWLAGSYAGHFAFLKEEGNALEMLAVVVFPHVVVWEDIRLRDAKC
ncbi:MAG: hypothetical protein K6T30_02200 [Alicyclobacillus sp.]|nr:hypothetical protein [Alicyclobacillus sp.]